MNNLKQFDIQFSGLKNGKHNFNFNVDRSLLDYYNYKEVNDCDVQIVVEVDKSDTMLEFSIVSKGIVVVPCDISNELYEQEIEGNLEFIVKFGKEYNDERDDLIILPFNSYVINIAQQIYENIVLNIPLKKIHPDILTGKRKNKNTEYIINFGQNKKEKKEYDPRWEALKKLLTDKKK